MIAESYFQEEDYEKAMQFIQLERIYHEQLLANLSVIQEEWETKWRMVECSKLPDNSEKSLSSLDLEKLSKLCGSHEEPKISKNRLTSAEKVLRIQGLTRLMQAEERHEVDREAGNPDGDTHAGRKPRKGRAPALTVMTEYTPSEARTVEDLSTAIDSKDLPNLGHVQEQQIYISSLTTEDHTQSIGTVGRSKSSTFSSGDSGKNNKLLQAEAIPVFNDVLELEESSREKEEHKGKTVIEKLISASSAHVDCGLVTQDDFSGMRNSSDCTKAVKSLQIKDRADAQYPDVGNEDIPLISTQIVDCTSREILEFSENTGCQNCLSDSDRDDQRQATVDFIAAFLSFQEETLSEEEITPSLGNTVLDELDELAKRIEVEEESPVAGLVSILKKHSESEKPGRSFKKQTKRKVHFQETEDSLEQEEIGGSSCILLILLCIATVFLSIGGTALYCTFGDVESSVCKDFAANMDFYYTQLLQGIEELKHWLYVA
ncbi:hypothetical protein GDO86_009532 [Hymenochirus boettgeri]|uniref:Consortin C-terminal domain-containing protein n=1 Tax=Hymenochirus boettgeri TaxID=247094 RepID=A0A8T2JKW5_9PIPI|nr:hypothetical protein GDO86_009532 [Hymenochirus boettgeri]